MQIMQKLAKAQSQLDKRILGLAMVLESAMAQGPRRKFIPERHGHRAHVHK
jgi:hypothetical protein